MATLDSVNDPYEWVPCTKEVPSDYAREFWYKKYGNKVGLICLCIDPDNPVMWSHYGDRHSGMVLGFDCALDQFKPVHYLDDRVSFDGIENLDEASRFQLFNEFLFQKFTDWDYENEYRLYIDLEVAAKKIIINNKLRHFVNIDNELMKLEEIIVGCNAHGRVGEVVDVLRQGNWICDSNTPKLKVAQFSSTYRMKIVDVTY
ncbi:MAG: DUF2971 domain-containing protein [bacterium]